MGVDSKVGTLSAAFDDYPHTRALLRGEVRSPQFGLTFSDIRPANRFFKAMVRDLAFDVSEMAIATFVQAKALGKPLVLLPATMMGRFQHGSLLCSAARPVRPAELPGKRVGVRSYSQTTAVWVRGILCDDYGVDVERIHWVTQEDGHLAEYREPASVERIGGDAGLLDMLRAGEIDAAIYGTDPPDDPALQSVIVNPDAAARAWFARHRVVPINHMVVVTERLARSDPGAVKEIYRLLALSKAAAARPAAQEIDFLPFGYAACRPALATIVNYALRQNIIARKIAVDDLYDDTTRAIGN